MPYKDPEKAREYRRAYYKKYQPEWRKKHPTYQSNYLREYRKANPDKAKTYEENRKEGYRKRYENYVAKNAHKIKARKALTYAIKAGKVIKPTHCQECKQEVKLEADHYDYSKPYDVTWLCRPCHLEYTVRRNRLGIII